MSNSWGWENNKKNVNKVFLFIKIWKGTILFIIGVIFLSFFSIVNKVVYAGKFDLNKKISNLSLANTDFSFLNLISQIKNKQNFLTEKNLLLVDKYFDSIVSILGYSSVKDQLKNIYKEFRPYWKDIFYLLGKNGEKKYLVVFENSSEERPFGGFMGSFAKITFSGGILKDLKFYDSYYVLYKLCKNSSNISTGFNVFENCNKSIWSLKNNNPYTLGIFPTTTFINANIFGFTKLNGENVAKHYERAFKEKIDGVIFVKSDILKYLVPDGEKVLWKLEAINYKQLKAKKEGKFKKVIAENIVGGGGVKGKYLLEVSSILKNKKQLIKNFILNYNKIKSLHLVRVYFPNISNSFQKFLKENGFMIYNDEKSAYLFFYNLGGNKSSKFIDHIIKVNDTIYINKYKFPLIKGKNIIQIKNVFKKNPEYYEFLKKNKIDKSSYLWDKSLSGIKELLILPSNCVEETKTSNVYIVNCN